MDSQRRPARHDGDAQTPEATKACRRWQAKAETAMKSFETAPQGRSLLPMRLLVTTRLLFSVNSYMIILLIWI